MPRSSSKPQGPSPIDRRGILVPDGGEGRFALSRHAPSERLSRWIDRYWVVRWDLRGAAPYAQETLPFPAVNVVCGTHRPGVHGVNTARFVARLSGVGWVLGAKFRPGGFVPFLPPPWTMASLKNREFPIEALYGDDGRRLDEAVASTDDDHERIALMEAFFTERAPSGDTASEPRVPSLLALLQGDPSLVRVDLLAERAGLSMRSIQRLFLQEVGVPASQVVRRARVQEAAERVARWGASPGTWADLAAELGYTDQSHFIRDFKQQIGQTPTRYARRCAGRS